VFRALEPVSVKGMGVRGVVGRAPGKRGHLKPEHRTLPAGGQLARKWSPRGAPKAAPVQG
jgi:hypothetical protein